MKKERDRDTEIQKDEQRYSEIERQRQKDRETLYNPGQPQT